ncbi:hypothetical protein CJ030_MR1G008772 [Morella rubra]|uniref:Uncharacterized protein n=1 Tax=Morella rubra TaxID=262757 RepID=A0A6A1WRB3_9ROSI|nr:hypothetical protein CJ030_MR1G008772 [Morella rubra]
MLGNKELKLMANRRYSQYQSLLLHLENLQIVPLLHVLLALDVLPLLPPFPCCPASHSSGSWRYAAYESSFITGEPFCMQQCAAKWSGLEASFVTDLFCIEDPG